MEDIRDIIFRDIIDREFRALLIPEREGCLSGVSEAEKQAEEIGIKLTLFAKEGESVTEGTPVGELTATPKKIALSEEKIIGTLSKFSGIATAARRAVALANGKIHIVSGSWKKMPPSIKDGVRRAIVSGGASFRICDTPMIYLDKNYISMLGSIPLALAAVKDYTGYTRVIQIKGRQLSIEKETVQALENGCGILMVDTGRLDDLVCCSEIVKKLGKRNDVKIAFAGGVKLDKIKELAAYDIDILCIGKEIVDAPLLDIKLDVQATVL
ncbi:MAG: quinolinate phosphoribosyl transferase [Clostridiaceae bacterium]